MNIVCVGRIPKRCIQDFISGNAIALELVAQLWYSKKGVTHEALAKDTCDAARRSGHSRVEVT
jgi:hypothetical protein